MTVTPKQHEAAQLYGQLMSEVAQRIDLVNAGSIVKLHLPIAVIRELCFLQLRMICELIALACLVAHGDIAQTTALRTAWNADKIIKKLERLHPNFFPAPATIESFDSTNHLVTEGHAVMTKVALLSLYHECDHHMHRGHLDAILSGVSPNFIDYSVIMQHGQNLLALLKAHSITTLSTNVKIVCVLPDTPTGLTHTHIARKDSAVPGGRAYIFEPPISSS